MTVDVVVNDVPNVEQFNPTIIPYQHDVIKLVRKDHDYKKGILEILLSGSYGSAKSILMAHLAVTHCSMYPKAALLIGRRAMPDLKDTIAKKILDHMDGVFIEGHHFDYNQQKASFKFWNGSEMISRSWADKNYKKLRSLDLSAAIVEEVTENSSIEFEEYVKQLVPRLNRKPSVPERFMISATNPDSPAHAAYDYYIATNNPNRYVFYSVTTDNPFLPPDYVNQLMSMFTAQEIKRYVHGLWVEIKSDSIYYAYNKERSRISKYDIDIRHPIYISFDFNIGENKPMSATLSQYKDGKFFFFDEIVIHSARTLDVMEEVNARGYLDLPCKFIIHGDATGKARDTRSIHSDYQIITKYLASLENKYGPIVFEVDVPMSNPPIRERHTLVNGQLCNAFSEVSVYIVTEKCKMLDKGLRLTSLKKGGNYIEDDSDEWQHVTTAMGYHIVRCLKNSDTRDRFRKTKVN